MFVSDRQIEKIEQIWVHKRYQEGVQRISGAYFGQVPTFVVRIEDSMFEAEEIEVEEEGRGLGAIDWEEQVIFSVFIA